jgi:outer membrane protein W
MRKFYIIIAFTCIQFINAQESGKFRMDIDAFYALASRGNGFGLALEPKFNIADNMNVGLRISSAYIARDGSPFKNALIYGYDENYDFVESTETVSASVGGTFDYYFDELTGSSFTPFAGAGIMYTIVSNDYDDSSHIGGMVRAGLEVGKFRFSAEYNYPCFRC